MDLAQMAGWFAAGAAIIAMLQKSDLRLKQGLIIHTVLYAIPALRRRSHHLQRCDSVGSFAFHSRNSSFGSKRRADAVVVSIRRSQVTTRIIGGSVLWLIHNIYVQSWGGICLEACFCLSTLWGLWTMVQEQNENSKKEVCL